MGKRKGDIPPPPSAKSADMEPLDPPEGSPDYVMSMCNLNFPLRPPTYTYRISPTFLRVLIPRLSLGAFMVAFWVGASMTACSSLADTNRRQHFLFAG